MYILLFTFLSVWVTNGMAEDQYTGSDVCKSCHAEQHQSWQKSHHQQSMARATAKTVKGDFNNAVFKYAGMQHRFYKKNDRYFVYTDNSQGQMQDFEIQYVFGVEPLQQYLIGMPDGRYQALSIAWDSRGRAEGGQHWYHLYPDENIKAGDSLHWTGYYQNWNSRCASCHSTNLEKKYSVQSNRFNTTFSQINVACEACHGAGRKHVEWARSGNKKSGDTGLLSLSDRGQWAFKPGATIAHRVDGRHPRQQLETCASCHSLRSELTEFKPGQPFDQQHGLRLLEPPLYQADGQIADEVYVYGSFLQSKMAQAGVVCSDCHDAHSGRVRGGAENICMQCHQSDTYNTPGHHQHVAGSRGSFCVDCHMSEKTYMGVDARRDHSFSIPHPELSQELAITNACTQCHDKETDEWALKARQQWPDNKHFGNGEDVEFARVLAEGRKMNPTVLPSLIELINNPSLPDIKRATALQELASYPSQQAFQTAMAILQTGSPLMRMAAIRSLAYVPVEKRRGYVSLLNDDSKLVRMELAPFIAAVPTHNLPEPINEMLGELFAEYIALQQSREDMPSAQLNLGNFYLSLGAPVEAGKAFKQALIIAPSYTPALLNLADLYRSYGNEKTAHQYLIKAQELADDTAAAAHAMGLYHIRNKDT
ncbi:multiheme c-type cytochrome, partial [Endozoicomonas sp.]|uniref:multiheme c-type cytochrome n=1 Tax=Endozoicomonas sp. TaxID=1892382 RepID=UPI00383A7CAE